MHWRRMGAARVGGLLCRTVMLAAVALLAACSSNSRTGGNQALHIGSEPEGAECELLRDGQSLGKVSTPAPITISRAKGEPIQVVCIKPGYEEGRRLLTVEAADQQPFIGGAGAVGGLFALAYLVDKATRPEPGYKTFI